MTALLVIGSGGIIYLGLGGVVLTWLDAASRLNGRLIEWARENPLGGIVPVLVFWPIIIAIAYQQYRRTKRRDKADYLGPYQRY